ncbi:MAG: transcription antitermination factor NusB [Desulfobulbus propionicus]|nr:MAG: transcription antitermination factor NusB [Desulfobulbus propionicus]
MGLRRKSRELALQFLFSHDFYGHGGPGTLGPLLDTDLARFSELVELENSAEKAMPYAHRLIKGICSGVEGIDTRLRAHSHNWRLERMSGVDRNILRIAVYEMQCVDDVPPQVAINEALEIAKRYSINDSVAFINGILDAVRSALK